jgi:hypothetical protein
MHGNLHIKRFPRKEILAQIRVTSYIVSQICLQTDVLSFDALFVQIILSVHIDVIPCQGQHPQPVMLALWEEPKPLAMKE